VNRFNLTFSGEILAGEDPEQVRLRFADMFGIEDRDRLERFFSGETIILRRNLERKDAAELYHQLQLLGAVGALVKVTTSEMADELVNTSAASAPKTPAKKPSTKRKRDTAGSTQTAAPPATGTVASAPDARWTSHSTDAAAEIKARKLAAQRLAAEHAAREKAEEEARQRIAAEAAAQQAAKEAELKRLEQEEAARKKAMKAEARRKAAEEAAQRKAERAREKAEKAQRKAEAAERRKAEAREKKRLAAEQEARRKAELAEQKRLAEEAEARRKAEIAEQKRLAEEAEARRKAELAEQKRVAEEAEARRKAELAEQKRLAEEAEAKRQAEIAEKRRLVEEAEAKRQAELEAKKQQEAEREAQRKAALEKKKRLEAEKQARRLAELEQAKRLAAEEEARKIAVEAKKAAALQAELEEKARQAAAQAARIKAEAQRLEQEALRQSQQRRRLADNEHAATDRAAAIDRSDPTESGRERSNTVVGPGGALRAVKSGKNRVKTSLDVPLRQTGQTPEIGKPAQRRRQLAAPNLYKIRPFRNTQAVQARSALARQRMRKACTAGGIAMAALLVLGGIFLQTRGAPPITGASAVAVNTHSEPVLLAGDALLLHDRAGVSSTSVTLDALGVDALQPPLVFTDEGALIAQGQLSGEQTAAGLLRCDLARSRCEQFTAQLMDNTIATFTINRLKGSVLLADVAHRQLLKIDRAGALIASTDLSFAPSPVLRLHDGLLLMNSASGPAISVYRYEDSAFGQQLDEILLLPPSQLPLESSRVSDFIWSGDAWWVVLRDTQSGSAALHRFDRDWSYLDTVPLESDNAPVQLIRWGEKTLVNDPHNPAIQRFNAQGLVEAPFVSTQLQSLINSQQRRERLTRFAWNGGLLLCALAALLGFGLGYLHWMRTLVYRTQREQGAEPLDDYANALFWIEPVQNRPLQLRRTGILYGACALCAVLLAIALGVSVWQLAALLLVLCGPAIALLLLSRQPVGHIGVLGERLLLVDHSGEYHLGGGPRLSYLGPFLSIDDIVVFTGSRLLPAFSPAPLKQHISPAAMGGIKVDTTTIAVKLLESRHPLALGGVAIAAATAAGALLLLVQGLF
jgi:hypothetical protein